MLAWLRGTTMPERISPVRMREIDYILRFPGKFTKADICEAARQLREEINLLEQQIKRTLSINPEHEGSPS